MNSKLSELKNIIWPINGIEHKKFLPMAAMMFCILLNYSMFRSIKDGFVVSAIGPESLGFLKTYIVLPSAIIFMIVYTKLCNIMNTHKVFYVVTSFFLAFLILFTFLLYPYQSYFHPDESMVDSLVHAFPRFKWFIKIAGQWSLALFYMISELWGTVMLTLFFWQFANQTTKTDEAKRFYSTYGILGNLGLPCTAFILSSFLSEEKIDMEHSFVPVLSIGIILTIAIMIIYSWMVRNVLTDIRLYNPEIIGEKKSKKKLKLSLMSSFKVIFSSKYLGLIAILVLAYGVSINLVEGVWKDKIRELYPSKEAYTVYMGNFQKWQGWTTILFMIVGSNILRKVSWTFAAILTPLMILITGLLFFTFIFFDNIILDYFTGFMLFQPLAVAVTIGTIQNVLSKATKYSLFDSTKEMSYIPLDDDLKTKGKAAVDVVGGRMGKSGGGVIQSTFFLLLPTYTFHDASPYFAAIFFAVVIAWLYAAKSLGVLYNEQIKDKK
jgi:AAA family ATP:ADP antiporter